MSFSHISTSCKEGCALHNEIIPLAEKELETLCAWSNRALILADDTHIHFLNDIAKQMRLKAEPLRRLLVTCPASRIEVPQLDGQRIWVECTCRRVLWHGSVYIFAEMHNCMQEQTLLFRVNRISAARQLMLEVSQRISSPDNSESDLYDFVLEHALKAMGRSTLSSILLLDGDGMLSVAAQAGYSSSMAGKHLELKDCFLYLATDGRMDRIVNIPNLTPYYQYYYPVHINGDERALLRSTLSAPLHVGGKLIGMLNFDALEPNAFDDDDIQLMEFLRNNIEIAIANQQNFRERLFYSRHDALTGVANRAFFEESFPKFLEGTPAGSSAWIVMFDLDHLKLVNDRYGHGAGDAVITEFARGLSAEKGANELLTRIGGDEFVGAYYAPSREALNARMESLVRHLSGSPIRVKEHALTLSFSYGIAGPVTIPAELSEMVRTADELMYSYKRLTEAEG
jgi:diguanylate cyclase (GGDEF)-like protein